MEPIEYVPVVSFPGAGSIRTLLKSRKSNANTADRGVREAADLPDQAWMAAKVKEGADLQD